MHGRESDEEDNEDVREGAAEPSGSLGSFVCVRQCVEGCAGRGVRWVMRRWKGGGMGRRKGGEVKGLKTYGSGGYIRAEEGDWGGFAPRRRAAKGPRRERSGGVNWGEGRVVRL